MMRLTPSKLIGYSVKGRAFFTRRGNTSMIFKTHDPDVLEVFTIELVKMDWWRRGLELIDDYDMVCDALYVGFRNGRWQHVLTPVYRCFVPRLTPAPLRRNERRKIIDSVYAQRCLSSMSPNPLWRTDMWVALADHPCAAIAKAANFILDYDAPRIHLDVTTSDFYIYRNEVIVLDPFFHSHTANALDLSRYPTYSYLAA